MPLTTEEIENLLRLISRTSDVELNCEQCLALVAEFAEQQLAGKSIRQGLQMVHQHISVCLECREEYEALEKTLIRLEQAVEQDNCDCC